MKRSDISCSMLAADNGITENLVLLSNDPRKSTFDLEENYVGEKIGDSSSRTNEARAGKFMQYPDEEDEIDGDELPLRQSVQK